MKDGKGVLSWELSYPKLWSLDFSFAGVTAWYWRFGEHFPAGVRSIAMGS